MNNPYYPNTGESVRIQDASGDWYPAVAVSPVEGTHATDPETGRQIKIHDFPVVWVDADGRDGKLHRMPWPVGYVLPSQDLPPAP